MRKAATVVLFVLLGGIVALAQSPGSSSSGPQNPSSQTGGTAVPTAAPAPPGSSNGESASGSAQTTQTPAQTEPAASEPSMPRPTSTAPTTTQPAAVQPNATEPAAGNADQNSAQAPIMNAQQVAPAPTGNDQVAANTEIHAVLDTPLSSKTSTPGDRFTATVSDPVRATNGAVVIPAGARIEGEVAEAEQGKTLPALRGKGQLSLRFRAVALPNGQTLPLMATLVSVNNTNGKKKADEEGQIQSGTQGKDVAKDVGIGAGVGTVAGLIFGSPLKGLAVGALAGGGYVLATKGKDVELPAQTGMVIRLNQPINSNSLGAAQPMQR